MFESTSVRDLLFCVLSLEYNLVDRKELMQAISHWMVDKRQSIAEILSTNEAMSEQHRRLIDNLIHKRLENGTESSGQTIDLMSLGDALRNELGEVGATLPHEPPNEGHSATPLNAFESTVAVTKSNSPSNDRLPSGDRYRIVRKFAEGGLGKVSLAMDLELDREVALKEIKPKFIDDPALRSRFTLEAEITGGLEHPGIVPVYGLGTRSDGQPFYAMRLIRGISLHDACASYHKAKPERNASENALEFRNLLSRFVSVCNAIEYAHSRGVIHRDLKPSNIMLGKYGETLVVDWGLAKSVIRGDQIGSAAEETVLRPRSANQASATEMGSVVGTPAFMSPEQASGDLSSVGPTSDVYSLGATLYFLLANRPPFRSQSVEDLLEKVKSGKLKPPHDLDSSIDSTLSSICIKAMSRRPLERYTSALSLAQDVEKYLADEPTSAHQDPVVVRARRWARKHPRVVASTAATLFVTMASLLVGSSIVAAKNDQLSDKNLELSVANNLAVEAQTTAEQNEAAARQQSQLALTTLTSVIRDIQGGLDDLPQSGEIRRRLLATSVDRLSDVATPFVDQALIDRNTMVALHEMGDLLLELGINDESAEFVSDRAQPITSERNSAIKLSELLHRKGYEIASQLLRVDPDNLEAQFDWSLSCEKLGETQLALGKVSDAFGLQEEARQIRIRLRDLEPNDDRYSQALISSHNKVGNLLIRSGNSKEARKAFEEALGLCDESVIGQPGNLDAKRDLAIIYQGLGSVELRLSALDLAHDHLEKARSVFEELASIEEDGVRSQRDLMSCLGFFGDVQWQRGSIKSATETFRQMLSVTEQLVKDDPKNEAWQSSLATSLKKLSQTLVQQGMLDEALELSRRSLLIERELAQADPRNSERQRGLAISLERLANVLSRSRKFEDAVKLLRESIEIRRRLANIDPTDTQAQRDLGVAFDNIGDIQLELNRPEQALESYQEGLRINRSMAESNPTNSVAMRGLSFACLNIGRVYLKLGQLDEATLYLEEATELRRSLSSAEPNDQKVKHDLAIALGDLGNLKASRALFEDALVFFRESREILLEEVEDHPTDTLAIDSLIICYTSIGDALQDSSKPKEALESYQLAVDVGENLLVQKPGDPRFLFHMVAVFDRIGRIQLSLSRTEEALEALEKNALYGGRLLELEPGNVNLLHSQFYTLLQLGMVAKSAGEFDEAIESLNQATEFGSQFVAQSPKNVAQSPKNVEAQNNLRIAFDQLGDLHRQRSNYGLAEIAFQRSCEVSTAMIALGIRVEQASQSLARSQQWLKTAQQFQLALGDWETLMALPPSKRAEMMDWRAVELIKQSRFDEAVEAADALCEIESASPDFLYNAACIYSIRASITDLEEDTSQKRKLLIEQALNALRRAVDSGWDNFELMRTDSDLAVLREHPEFLELFPKSR